MGRLILKGRALALLFMLLSALPGHALGWEEQETDVKTASKTREEAVQGSQLIKPHFASGNQAMLDAKAIRQQLQNAASEQRPALRRVK